MKSRKPAAFYVPVDLSLSFLPKPLHGAAQYFLNLIHWKTCWWRADPDGFVYLKQKYLTRVIPARSWLTVKHRLVDAGVVVSDLKVAWGAKAEGYRITDPYRQTHRIECADPTINKKIWKLADDNDRYLLPVHRWLRDKLSLLKFDMAKATVFLATAKPRKRGFSVKDYRRQRKNYCQLIADGEHVLSCDEYGRVHTLITALEKELRSCLTVGGKPLVGLDLANSQPLLLGLLAKQFLASRMCRARTLDREFARDKHPYRHKVGGAQAATLPDDLVRYMQACVAGTFYESLMTDADRAKGKAKFKERFYRVLFGRNRSKNGFPNVLRMRFALKYPTVAKVLHQLKSRNYKQSAYVLQNYEATLFIYRICGRIMEERPRIPLYTIHDCLLTTDEHYDYIRGVMLDEFAKLGVTPQIRKETYDGHQAI